jgi:hypothetical protein
MEFDIFIPDKELALEYQGKQHYVPFYSSEHIQKERDQEKREKCWENHTFTLIEIPYWWENDVESLRKTIHTYRPDLC